MRLLILLLLLTPTINFAQTFEGKIRFTNSYKSKSPQLKDEQLESMMGTIQDYYIKGGDYKSITNGSYLKMQLYRSTENRGYILTSKSDSLYWEDYSKNKDVVTKFDVKKGKETIMGVLCDVLIIYTLKSKASYYYSSKYGVNPDLYKQHAYGNWYYIVSKIKALPLKTVYESERFTFTSIAVNIIPMKLEAKVFKPLDKNKIAPATW